MKFGPASGSAKFSLKATTRICTNDGNVKVRNAFVGSDNIPHDSLRGGVDDRRVRKRDEPRAEDARLSLRARQRHEGREC